MQQFHYQAIDADGRHVDGSIEAASLHDASEKLRAAEINVIALRDGTDSNRRYEPDGSRPGPAPRDVKVRVSDVPGGRVLALVGAGFTAIASFFLLIGVTMLIAGGGTQGLFFALFPLIHLSVGLGLLLYVFGRRRKRIAIYRDGEVAMATVDGVGHNRSVRVNGRNPYEMTWSFDVDGHRFHDKRSSFDDRLLTFAPGDRLWVIYDPADPEESAEWPPFTR